MYDLASHLEQINETTTMDAISFIPSQMGVVQSALSKLAQEKLDWDIEILEGEEGHDVNIGGRLRVSVPIKDWEEFTSLFGRDIRQDKSINLKGGYNEAITMGPPKFRNALRRAFHGVFKQRKVQAFEGIMARWLSEFPQSLYLTGKTPAICLETRKKDITNLIHAVVKQHESVQDREAFLLKLKETKELEQDPVFKSHPWFAGTRISSVYGGVSMVFEGSLGYDGNVAISVLIHDPEVVEAVAHKGLHGVRIKNLFCTTERNTKLIGVIKATIDEMCDDEELIEKNEILEAKQVAEAIAAAKAEKKAKRMEAKHAPSN